MGFVENPRGGRRCWPWGLGEPSLRPFEHVLFAWAMHVGNFSKWMVVKKWCSREGFVLDWRPGR